MVQTVLYIAISVDGYIAAADGNVDWLTAFETEPADYGYDQFYGEVDALIMGRKTYEQVLTFGAWPYPGKPTYVMSRRQLQVNGPQVMATSLSPVELLAELDRQQLKRVWLVGGAAVTAAFRAENLISEYILSVMPVMLGQGISLFTPLVCQADLELVAVQNFATGIVQLTYKAATPISRNRL